MSILLLELVASKKSFIDRKVSTRILPITKPSLSHIYKTLMDLDLAQVICKHLTSKYIAITNTVIFKNIIVILSNFDLM